VPASSAGRFGPRRRPRDANLARIRRWIHDPTPACPIPKRQVGGGGLTPTVAPVTFRQACQFIDATTATIAPGTLFALGVTDGHTLVEVATIRRPVARHLDTAAPPRSPKSRRTSPATPIPRCMPAC
jgi:hypothetical protein